MYPFRWGGTAQTEIRQVWNVVEGQHGAVRVVIFDSLFGNFGWNTYQYLTIIACQDEGNTCGLVSDSHSAIQRDYVTHSHGWTALYELPRFPMNPVATWGMSIQGLEHHLNRVGRSAIEIEE